MVEICRSIDSSDDVIKVSEETLDNVQNVRSLIRGVLKNQGNCYKLIYRLQMLTSPQVTVCFKKKCTISGRVHNYKLNDSLGFENFTS